MDSRARSWVKAVLWNVIGFTVMSLVGIAVTGSASLGGALALANTGLGLMTYVIYERVWARVSWGRAHE